MRECGEEGERGEEGRRAARFVVALKINADHCPGELRATPLSACRTTQEVGRDQEDNKMAG